MSSEPFHAFVVVIHFNTIERFKVEKRSSLRNVLFLWDIPVMLSTTIFTQDSDLIQHTNLMLLQ